MMYPPRWMVRGSLACVAGLLLVVSTAQAQSDRWKTRIKELADAHKGEVAVSVVHPASGESFALNADKPMPTASLIKTPLMVAAYRQVDAGKLDMSKLVTMTKDDMVPGSGVLTPHFSAGLQLSLRDATRLMIAFSDNTATNLVADAIGLPETAKVMEELGYPNTKLHAKVFKGSTSIFPDRSKEFGLGSTTANETTSLLARLYKGELASEESTKLMLGHLRACESKATIPRLLPPGTKIGHKTGSVNKVRTAGGYIEFSNGPVFICVLTNNNEDQRWVDANEGEVLIAEISKVVYERFNPDRRPGRPSVEPLKLGANGTRVEDLQRTLNERMTPSPNLSVDGDFGAGTEAAVKAFQASKDLPTNGVVDAAVWRALGPLVTAQQMITDRSKIDDSVPDKKPADDLTGAPFVSARSWVVMDPETGKLLAGQNEDLSVPMASTTKMMTAWLVLKEARKNPAVFDEMVSVTERADRTIGSTADIRAGEQVSVRDLLYGLMLPSGNDAATAFAEHFGSRFDAPAESPDDRDPLNRFVAEMNRTAVALGLEGTRFTDPHGLSSDGHHARARDLATLAKVMFDDGQIQEFVKTRKHVGTLKGPSGYTRYELWVNTNRLLGIEGYLGLKTGTTTPAGACLVSVGERDGKRLIIVVLGATSTDARYMDTRNLYRWAWQHLVPKAPIADAG